MLLSDGSVRRLDLLGAECIRPQTVADALRAGHVARAPDAAHHMDRTALSYDKVDLAGTCMRMPRAVVCLLSAAHLEGLAFEQPGKLWLALPQGVHATTVGDTPRHILRWSYRGAFDVGVIEDEVCGVKLKRTSGARTVVDLFRYAKHLRGVMSGIAAARRHVEAGGKPGDFLTVAEHLKVPVATMRDLTVAAAALQEPGR